MDDDIARRFRAVASRWDLGGLRSEVTAALDDIEPSQRPYVPTQLVRALDMVIDSYGSEPGVADESPATSMRRRPPTE